MANYFYVKAGGTATGATADASATNGIATTKLTGTWSVTATEYFATIAAAHAGVVAPAAGDFIVVSDAHQEDVTSVVAYGLDLDGAGTTVTIISVDNANRETPKIGTAYQLGITGAGIAQLVNAHVYNLYMDVDRDVPIQVVTAINQVSTLNNCKIDVSGGVADHLFKLGIADSCLIVNDTEVIVGATVTGQKLVNAISVNTYFEANRLSVSGTGTTDAVIGTINSSSTSKHTGCDYSKYTALILATGGGASDDKQQHEFYSCEVGVNATLFTETLLNYEPTHALTYNCTDSTNQNPNQFEYENYSGTIKSEFEDAVPTGSGVVRTSGTLMSMEASSLYMSAKFTTLSTCSLWYPINFSLPAKWSPLSTATDTVRIYITSSSALTEADVGVKLVYRDATNIEQISTAGSLEDPYTPSTTALTTDAVSTWVNAAALNKYYIDVATTNALDQVPEIIISVSLASATIYIDTEYDLV